MLMKSMKCLCLILFADLALGDCHLIPIDDVSSRKDGHDWVSILSMAESFQGVQPVTVLPVNSFLLCYC